MVRVSDYEININNFIDILKDAEAKPEFLILNYDADWFLRKIKNRKWDVIIIDFPDPQTIELAKLYSWEFYVKVRSVLTKNGIIVTQATSPYYAKEVFLCINRTMKAAGFKTILYQGFIGSFGGNWGWIIGHLLADDNLDERLKLFDQLHFFEVKSRYLSPNMFKAFRIFGKGDLIAKEYPNTINYLTSTPTLNVIYEKSWKNI